MTSQRFLKAQHREDLKIAETEDTNKDHVCVMKVGLILKDLAEFSPEKLGQKKLGQKKQCREDLKIAETGEEQALAYAPIQLPDNFQTP